MAVVVYVALDLSMPMMPGAFVFEPTDSVESAQSKRPRPTADIDVASPLVTPATTATRPADVRDRVATREVARAVTPWLNALPRATLEPAPPAEDPH